MKVFAAAMALTAAVSLATGAFAQSSSGSTAQPPASSDQSSASTPGQSGVLIDANSIIGTTVRSQGKDVGKVDRLMVDPKDGRVKTIVIQMGGTLGVGGKSVSMPWEAVRIGQDGDRIVVSAEQQMLEQAPAASPRTDSNSDKSGDKSDSKKK